MSVKSGESHIEPELPGSPCCSDPLAELPPELYPKPAVKSGGLRRTTCPACGLEYWTNRLTDLCIRCSK